MLPIILIILFLALFVIMLVPAIIISLVSRILSIFGIRNRNRRHFTYHRTGFDGSSAGYGQWTGSRKASSARTSRDDSKPKKLFDKSEGEYVDFEEIK
jgi:hypothetical protein